MLAKFLANDDDDNDEHEVVGGRSFYLCLIEIYGFCKRFWVKVFNKPHNLLFISQLIWLQTKKLCLHNCVKG